MPQVYTYKVRDAAGKVVTGSLEAASSQLVAAPSVDIAASGSVAGLSTIEGQLMDADTGAASCAAGLSPPPSMRSTR